MLKCTQFCIWQKLLFKQIQSWNLSEIAYELKTWLKRNRHSSEGETKRFLHWKDTHSQNCAYKGKKYYLILDSDGCPYKRYKCESISLSKVPLKKEKTGAASNSIEFHQCPLSVSLRRKSLFQFPHEGVKIFIDTLLNNIQPK